ncbi:MAG TPA: heme biosynthesis HemY N-terminal domain-containing protein, partial [Gallionella sp.]
MKYLISILVLFAAAVAISTLLQNTAYVLLVYPPYRIEVSLKLFVALFLLVFGFGYWLIHLLLATTQLPAVVQKLRIDRAQNNARKLLDVALRAFFEGRYQDAE